MNRLHKGCICCYELPGGMPEPIPPTSIPGHAPDLTIDLPWGRWGGPSTDQALNEGLIGAGFSSCAHPGLQMLNMLNMLNKDKSFESSLAAKTQWLGPGCW